MRILVADDQSSFRNLVASAIREQTDHEVIAVEDGAQALEVALGPQRPEVLILDWVMPKLSGTQVCRLVRATELDWQPYVLFVTGRCRREEVLECLASGADDLLTKPFAPDVLMSRLELAFRRSLATPTNVSVARALRDARDEGNGELVVRSGRVAARVLFSEGKVAWIQLADSFGTLLDAMGPETGLDAEAAKEILAECRRTGQGLGATLSAWGLVDKDRLREISKTWLRKKLSSLYLLERPQFLFLPGRQRCSPELLFEIDELLDTPPTESKRTEAARLPTLAPTEARPTSIPAADWSAAFVVQGEEEPILGSLLSRCMQADGLLGVVALDRITGSCLGRRGADLDPDITWAQVQMVNSIMLREKVEDGHVGTGKHLHLITLLPQRSEVLVYALFDNSKSVIASARLALRAALRA